MPKKRNKSASLCNRLSLSIESLGSVDTDLRLFYVVDLQQLGKFDVTTLCDMLVLSPLFW
jgi:hypothetical protein